MPILRSDFSVFALRVKCLMKLPEIQHDFSHSLITNAVAGPRRELSLTLQILRFEGSQGRYDNSIIARFGGITNIDEVKSFFANSFHSQSELAVLRYNEKSVSKPGHIFIELAFERIEAHLVIQCAHFTLTDEVDL